MSAYFNIYQSCTDSNRPPISFKVREYFVRFITDEVLNKKGLLNTEWNIILAIYYVGKGVRYTSREIFFPKGKPRVVKEERIKFYEIIIPLVVIEEAASPYEMIIKLMFDAIKIFLINTYKKITPELMDGLWEKIDVDYLLSLPYPADYAEQKYVGDK